MGKINWDMQIEPVDTPNADKVFTYIDSADYILTFKLSDGTVHKTLSDLPATTDLISPDGNTTLHLDDDIITLTSGATGTVISMTPSGITITGDATSTTQSPGDDSTKLATTAYVEAAVLVEDFWDRTGTELNPKATGDNIATTGTITGTTLAGDLNGTINTLTTGATQDPGDDSTKLATTGYVDAAVLIEDLWNKTDTTISPKVAGDGITTTGNITGTEFIGDLNGTINTLTTGVTQSPDDDSTLIATTEYVDSAVLVEDLWDRSGTELSPKVDGDKIKTTGDIEGTTLLGDLTGTINTATTGVTKAPGDNSTSMATTEYVEAAVLIEDLWDRSGTTLSPKVGSDNITTTGDITGTNLAGIGVYGDLTGTINTATTGVTQAPEDNSTKIATTAYVEAAIVDEELWSRVDTTISPKIAGDTLSLGNATGSRLKLYGDTYAIGVESSEFKLASNGKFSFFTGGYSGSEIASISDSGLFTVDSIDTLGIGNLAGDFNIQPGAQGDVELFGVTDVDDADNSRMLYLRRRAAEGNDYIRFYISGGRKGYIHTSCPLTLQAQTSFTINSITDDIIFSVGDNAGSTRFRFRDSDNNDVVTIDSNGVLRLDANVGGSLNITRGSNNSINTFMDATYTDIKFGGAKAENRIGTWIDQDFRIVTNSLPRVTVDNTGNVGIGTTDPTHPLSLASTAAGIKLENTRTTMGMGYNVGQLAFNAGELAHEDVGVINLIATEAWTDTSSPTRMEFYTTPVGSTQAEENMCVSPEGNVGIGTMYPTLPLEIHSVDDKQAMLLDTQAQAQGVGGGLCFGGKYNDAGDTALAALIEAEKCNSTTGDYDFDLVVEVQNTSNSLTECARFLTSGDVSMPNSLIVSDTINGAILEEDASLNIALGQALPANIGGSNLIVGHGNMTSMTSSAAHYNIAIGKNLAPTMEGNSDSNIFIGHDIMTDLTIATDTNVMIGYNIPMTNCENASDNIVIGHHCCDTASTFVNNLILGCNAVRSATNISNSTILGRSAGGLCTSPLVDVILLGYECPVPSGTTSNYMNLGGEIQANTDNHYVAISATTSKPSGPEKLWVDGALKVDDKINEIYIQYKDGAIIPNMSIGDEMPAYLIDDNPTTSYTQGNIFLGYGNAVNAGDTGGLVSGTNNIMIGMLNGQKMDGSHQDNIIIGRDSCNLRGVGDRNILIGANLDCIVGMEDYCLNIGGVLWGDIDGSRFRIGGNESDALLTGACLELKSTTGALLVTRMTTTQRSNMTPVNGMIIYNTTLAKMQFREGGSWVTK